MTLDEIEKICEEATPGPWEVKISGEDLVPFEQRLVSLGPISYWASHADDASLEIPDNDIAFISSARTYMPKLLTIAKAANRVWLYQDVLYDDHELALALKELEK